MIEVRIPLDSKDSIRHDYQAFTLHLEAALFDLQKKIRASLGSKQVQPTFKSRVKSFESYYQKLQKRATEAPQYKNWYLINDIIGIRVICPFIADLPVVEKVLNEEYIVREREKKGAEFSFKEFGYDSVHYLIEIPLEIKEFYQLPDLLVCEIQLRTILQDAWAEVEHELVYKSDHTPFDESLRRKLAALNANLSLADMIFHEIREYQRELKMQLKKRRHDFNSLLRIHSNQNSHTSILHSEEVYVPLPHYDVIDGHLLKAIHAHNQHRYEEAIETYTFIETLEPKSNTMNVILQHKGMALFALGRYEEAIICFNNGLRFGGDHKRTFYYRGVTHQRIKLYNDALNDFNESLQIDEHQIEVLLSRAQIFVHVGDYSQALNDVDLILRINPHENEAIELRNLVLTKIGV